MDKKIMMMNFDNVNAPESLKNAVKLHQKNFMRMKKSEDQFQKWNTEKEAAKAEFKVSLRKLNEELEKWTPDDNGLEDIK